MGLLDTLIRRHRPPRKSSAQAPAAMFEQLEPRLLLSGSFIDPIPVESSGDYGVGAIAIENDDRGTYTPSQTGSVSVPYTQDFSSGLPDAGWSYYSSNQGRIRVAGGQLWMDDTAADSTYSLNEARLYLNLAGKSGVTLTLDHTNIRGGDTSHPLPTSFKSHWDGDGISFSADGITWYTLTNLTSSFAAQSFDLDAAIQRAGISYTWNFKIKFQQYDNASYPVKGRGFDNIEISVNPPAVGIVSTGDFNDDDNEDLARTDAAGRWLVTTSQGNTEVWGAWSTAVTWNDVQAADVNGDGKADIIGRTDSGAWWAGISNGSSFTNQFMGAWAPISWNDVHAVNVNGDINGNTDIIGRTDSGAWWAGISNGSSFTNQFMGGWAAIPWNDVQVGNFDNDGKKDDVIGRTNDGAWWAGISNGSSFTNQFMDAWATTQRGFFGGWTGISWNDVQATDVNADGKTDIVGRTGSGAWWASVSNGSSFTNQFMGNWAPIYWNDVQAADVNGDGRVDIIGRTDGGDWWAGVSNGSSFTNEFITRWSSGVTWANVRVLDLNNDNEDDILGRVFDSDAWWVAISDGVGGSGTGYENELWS